jgi:hypothetical protein
MACTYHLSVGLGCDACRRYEEENSVHSVSFVAGDLEASSNTATDSDISDGLELLVELNPRVQARY